MTGFKKGPKHVGWFVYVCSEDGDAVFYGGIGYLDDVVLVRDFGRRCKLESAEDAERVVRMLRSLGYEAAAAVETRRD